MNKKFLPGAVLFIITFVLSNLASLAQVKAQTGATGANNTFYGEDAGLHITTGNGDSGFAIRCRLATAPFAM
jgi:hypothetical protein